MKSVRFLLSPVLLCSTLLAQEASPAAESETLGPDLSAAGLLDAALKAGAPEFPADQRKGKVRILINGEAMDVNVDVPGSVVLAQPGEALRLQAMLTGEEESSTDKSARRRTGFLTQYSLENIVWEAEPDDQLIEQEDGSVLWRPGTARGRTSYLTASAARLRWTAGLLPDEDVIPAATLISGKMGLLILSAAGFDRNGDGSLHGQMIGIYPDETGDNAPQSVRDNTERYQPPFAFYRIDSASADAKISRYHTLGDLAPPIFESDQSEARYVAIDRRLLSYLPHLYAAVRDGGLDPAKLTILRGYVSPNERRRLARQGVSLAEFTRHQYGDAISLIYTDDPESSMMSDLSGDGVADIADAERLSEYARQAMRQSEMFGALGVGASFGGPGAGKGSPYVHIDLRGFFLEFREE